MDDPGDREDVSDCHESIGSFFKNLDPADFQGAKCKKNQINVIVKESKTDQIGEVYNEKGD